MSKRVAQAIDDATEDDLILYPTMGGTLPLYHFEQTLDSPIIIVPIANHDNNQHAPDENIRIGNIWYGIEIYTAMFTMEWFWLSDPGLILNTILRESLQERVKNCEQQLKVCS